MTTTVKKPPRPWSADISCSRKVQHDSSKCYTTRSDASHDKYGRFYEATVSNNCCVYECRNPPNTPVNPLTCSRNKLTARQAVPTDEQGRCIRLRTISHSAPPLNFKTHWNPLLDRHPGSAFDVVSSASSSRTCTPEQTASRAELCASQPDLYDNPIVRPIPRKSSTLNFSQLSEDSLKEDEDLTLPDRLFRAQIQQNNSRLRKSIMQLEEDKNDSAMTLPDKIFKAHMAKLALDSSPLPLSSDTDVKPKILSKASTKGGSLGGGSVRNSLKDKFVLNIIESFSEPSNALSELSNMKLEENKPRKKKSFIRLRKTWSSIINLAVGVPPLSGPSASKDCLAPPKSKREHSDSLYTESMYSTLMGDIYKSRSTACIAAL